jgi:hypothetical protein
MLEIIGLACIGALWINAEPTIRLRSLYKKEDWFFRLINCCLCSTFWIALLYKLIWFQQFDLFVAASSSVLGELICKKLTEGKLW